MKQQHVSHPGGTAISTMYWTFTKNQALCDLPLWSSYANHFTKRDCGVVKILEQLSILIWKAPEHIAVVLTPWVIWLTPYLCPDSSLCTLPVASPATTFWVFFPCLDWPGWPWGLLSCSCPHSPSLRGWLLHSSWVSTHLRGLSCPPNTAACLSGSFSISLSCFILYILYFYYVLTDFHSFLIYF